MIRRFLATVIQLVNEDRKLALISLGLAVLVWQVADYRVHLAQETEELFWRVPIRYQNVPYNWDLMLDEAATVRLSIRGPRHIVPNRIRDGITIKVDFDEFELQPGTNHLRIDTQMVEFKDLPEYMRDRLRIKQDITPAELIFSATRYETRVDVELVLVEERAPGIVLAASSVVSNLGAQNKQLHLTGDREAVHNTRVITTKPLNEQVVIQEPQTLKLRLPDNMLNLRGLEVLNPGAFPLMATLQYVDVYGDLYLPNVAVYIPQQTGAPVVRAVPASVGVTLSVPLRVIETLSPANCVIVPSTMTMSALPFETTLDLVQPAIAELVAITPETVLLELVPPTTTPTPFPTHRMQQSPAVLPTEMPSPPSPTIEE